MVYSFKSLKQVIDLFNWNQELGASEISELLWKSRTIVHKYLKELVIQWKLVKVWIWSRVKYKKTIIVTTYKDKNNNFDFDVSFQDKKLLDDIFLKFSPEWKILKWLDWIINWCNYRDLKINDKIKLYIDTYRHILTLEDNCWLISAKKIFWKDFKKVYIDEIFYADQYNWMEFGRWKLAELTFYWKSSQNKKLINEAIDEIIYKLECKIKKEKYDSIAIVPWSIDRKNQLLKILKNRLKNIDLPFINIIKYYPNWIAIPQKSLKSREQRIQNAKNTIFIDDNNIKKYNKVFLIDDFVWSWSTLNETAKKLKEYWVNKVDWFAFVWNLNLKYEVINEM